MARKVKSTESSRNVNATHKAGMRTGSRPQRAPVSVIVIGEAPREFTEEEKEAARLAADKAARKPGGFY